MHTQKKKVVLNDGMVLYGVGVRSIVKYIVSHIPERNMFKFHIIGEHGRKSAFTTKQGFFYEGETIYKHGYRMFRQTAAIEKKYIIYLVKHSLYTKLKTIQQIMERAHKMPPKKMLPIAMLCDNMIREAAKIDRRIKINKERS